MSETLFHLSRKLEQSEIPSPSQKSASVVALFRLSPTSNRFPPSPSSSPDDFFYHLSKLHSNSLELLFIKRALNKKDIHSGQIAFPGGKVEKGESSKQAAIRETLEEIGVDLRSSNFHYLGHTPSENVYKHFRRRTLFVSVHSKSYSVFLFLGDDLSFTLNPKEVSQVFWTDFHLFTHGLLKAKTSVNFVINVFPLHFSGKVIAIDLGLDRRLWGITFGFVRKMVLGLPEKLRTCKRNDWISISFDFPHCFFGKLYELALLHCENPQFSLLFYAYHSGIIVGLTGLGFALTPRL